MLVAITGPVALNLIAEKSPNPDQSNITVVVDFPGTLFPVSVISVFSTCSHFSLDTTWSRGTCHALFTFSTISALAVW